MDDSILYCVEALRFGDRNKHSYVVGVYTSKVKATSAKLEEEKARGGKYACDITRLKLNEYITI